MTGEKTSENLDIKYKFCLSLWIDIRLGMRAVLFFLYFSSYPSNPIHPIKTYFQASHAHHRHLHLEKNKVTKRWKSIQSSRQIHSRFFFQFTFLVLAGCSGVQRSTKRLIEQSNYNFPFHKRSQTAKRPWKSQRALIPSEPRKEKERGGGWAVLTGR